LRSPNRVERQSVSDVDGLIAALRTSRPVDRTHAREGLVAIGGPAVDPLIRLLEDSRPHVRWEAVKALGSIGDRAAAPSLVGALEDEDDGIRWLAARGLIALGREALPPLLSALAYRPSSWTLLEGAHHALSGLYERGKLPGLAKPVLAALNGATPQMAVHMAAYVALDAIRAATSSEHAMLLP
jgi:HEAT repeat protein